MTMHASSSYTDCNNRRTITKNEKNKFLLSAKHTYYTHFVLLWHHFRWITESHRCLHIAAFVRAHLWSGLSFFYYYGNVTHMFHLNSDYTRYNLFLLFFFFFFFLILPPLPLLSLYIPSSSARMFFHCLTLVFLFSRCHRSARLNHEKQSRTYIYYIRTLVRYHNHYIFFLHIFFPTMFTFFFIKERKFHSNHIQWPVLLSFSLSFILGLCSWAQISFIRRNCYVFAIISLKKFFLQFRYHFFFI